MRLSQNVDQDYIPNIILYDMTKAGNLEIKIGDSARDTLVNPNINPENAVEYIKRKLELEEWAKEIPNLQRSLSVFEIATDIFHSISEKLQGKLNCTAEELHAIITVPVCSSGLQRSRIYQSAKSAGISVETIVTEPFAALFSMEDLLDENSNDETVLIFDFGGSTLDLSLLRVEHGDGTLIEELASVGLSYGGIDIDEAIFSEIIAKKYSEEINEIQSHDSSNNKAKTSYELRELTTTLKEKLFSDDDESIQYGRTFYGSGKYYEFELTRQELEDLFQHQDLRRKIFDLLDDLFSQTYLNRDEVTLVKPFGGTSQIKYFLDLLTEYFGADIFDSDDFEFEDESIADVAAGAVRYLSIRQNDSNIEIISKIPFSLGIARGKFFKKYINCAPPYGYRTKRIPLLWQDLKNNEYQVSVYQAFADTENLEIEGQNGAVYVGKVTVNPDLYQSEDGILLEMEMVDSGTLKMIFSEMRSSELQEIETQVINLKNLEN